MRIDIKPDIVRRLRFAASLADTSPTTLINRMLRERLPEIEQALGKALEKMKGQASEGEKS